MSSTLVRSEYLSRTRLAYWVQFDQAHRQVNAVLSWPEIKRVFRGSMGVRMEGGDIQFLKLTSDFQTQTWSLSVAAIKLGKQEHG